MQKFVEAVNRNGRKQRIPAAWLDPASPFAGQFRLPPSAQEKPAKNLTTTTKTPTTEGN